MGLRRTLTTSWTGPATLPALDILQNAMGPVDDRDAIIDAARELAALRLEEAAQVGEIVEVTAASLDREAARILRGIAASLEARKG